MEDEDKKRKHAHSMWQRGRGFKEREINTKTLLGSMRPGPTRTPALKFIPGPRGPAPPNWAYCHTLIDCDPPLTHKDTFSKHGTARCHCRGPIVYLGLSFVPLYPGHGPATWWSRGGCGLGEVDRPSWVTRWCWDSGVHWENVSGCECGY